MEDLGTLVLRLVIGGIFFIEGHHKAFHDADAFRGRNELAATIEGRGFPLPSLLALMVTAAEFIGSLMILAGLLMRVALIPLIVIVGMAAFVFKWKQGFLSGWDFPFSVAGSSLALFLLGPGDYSLDAYFDLPLLT